jgi:hypothetical protein
MVSDTLIQIMCYSYEPLTLRGQALGCCKDTIRAFLRLGCTEPLSPCK